MIAAVVLGEKKKRAPTIFTHLLTRAIHSRLILVYIHSPCSPMGVNKYLEECFNAEETYSDQK